MVAGRVGLDTPSDAVEGECVYVLVIVKACMCVNRCVCGGCCAYTMCACASCVCVRTYICERVFESVLCTTSCAWRSMVGLQQGTVTDNVSGVAGSHSPLACLGKGKRFITVTAACAMTCAALAAVTSSPVHASPVPISPWPAQSHGGGCH